MKRLAMLFVGTLAVLSFSSASSDDLVEGKQYTRL